MQKVVLNESGIEARAPFVLARLGFSMKVVEWQTVLAIEYCLFGMRIVYRRQVTYELEITALCAYDKTMSFLGESGQHQHLLADPTSNPKAPQV